MQGEFKTDRRNFLATAVTAASSALTIGLCHADALGQEAGAQSHPTTASPLSFDRLYNTSILANDTERRGGGSACTAQTSGRMGALCRRETR
jgi:hypothetical protein